MNFVLLHHSGRVLLCFDSITAVQFMTQFSSNEIVYGVHIKRKFINNFLFGHLYVIDKRKRGRGKDLEKETIKLRK